VIRVPKTTTTKKKTKKEKGAVLSIKFTKNVIKRKIMK